MDNRYSKSPRFRPFRRQLRHAGNTSHPSSRQSTSSGNKSSSPLMECSFVIARGSSFSVIARGISPEAISRLPRFLPRLRLAASACNDAERLLNTSPTDHDASMLALMFYLFKAILSLFHPHPCPLPSREREIGKVMILSPGGRDFHLVPLSPGGSGGCPSKLDKARVSGYTL